MKWIFALNAESVDSYGDFARVAVVSACKCSSLEAVCRFDGEEGEFTRWLEAQGGSGLARSQFYDDIARVAREKNEPFGFASGGAFCA
jgi:membrane protein required for beta-lactamase induction